MGGARVKIAYKGIEAFQQPPWDTKNSRTADQRQLTTRPAENVDSAAPGTDARTDLLIGQAAIANKDLPYLASGQATDALAFNRLSVCRRGEIRGLKTC